MKKILTAILLLMTVSFAYSQSKYAKDLGKSDADIVNPKKQDKPKTWIDRGNLFLKIADEPTEKVTLGFDEAQLPLFLKGEQVLETKEHKTPDGEELKVNIYNNKEIYLKDGKVAYLRATKTLVDEPLHKSLEAYKKAISLGGDAKALKISLISLNTALTNSALAEYAAGNLSKSVENFKAALECVDNPIVGNQDTSLMFNIGFVAMANKDYKTAEEFFTKVKDLGVVKEGAIYGNIYAAIKNQGDTVRAQEILMEGYKSYPANLAILAELINHYIAIGEDPVKILPMIHDAQKAAPDNVSLYYVEGNLYTKLSDFDNAEVAYKKAIDVNPNNPDAYYAIGTMYYNNGVNIQNAANDIADNAQYEKELEKANSFFKKSIEPLEKAFELNSNEKAFAEALKSVYFRFRADSPEMMEKYEKYHAIMEQ